MGLFVAPGLRESDINLQNLLIISRAFEQSNFQAREMEQLSTQSGSINALQTMQTIQSSKRPTKSSSESPPFDLSVNRGKCQQQGERLSQQCYCCGNTGDRAKDVRCPAKGKTCRSCGKVGHFSTV